MAHQVVWTKIILETFLEESGLNDRVSMGDGYVDAMFDNLVNAGLIWYNTEKEVDTYDKYSRIYI